MGAVQTVDCYCCLHVGFLLLGPCFDVNQSSGRLAQAAFAVVLKGTAENTYRVAPRAREYPHWTGWRRPCRVIDSADLHPQATPDDRHTPTASARKAIPLCRP